MFSKILKKYIIWTFLYSLILIVTYTIGIPLWLSYANYFLYFIIFILITENLKVSNLNKDIIRNFQILYLYISFVLLLALVIRTNKSDDWQSIIYIYSEIGLSIIVLYITIYLFLYAFNIKTNYKNRLFIVCGILAIGLVFINYYKFILDPTYLADDYTASAEYDVMNYLSKLIVIVQLLIFWFRYYKKYFVLSEYLEIVIFLFMLLNILEALHFIAFQHSLAIFVYGQYFNFLLNILFVVVWYVRLEYLNTEMSKENERYLANYQYLIGLIEKPKHSILQSVISRISSNYFLLFFAIVMSGLILLYLNKRINLYLMLNTVFILITILFAVFFSISSIKRQWKNQFGFILKDKAEMDKGRV